MAKDDNEPKLDDRALGVALEALRRDVEPLDPTARAIVARILRHVDEARAGLAQLAEHLARTVPTADLQREWRQNRKDGDA